MPEKMPPSQDDSAVVTSAASVVVVVVVVGGSVVVSPKYGLFHQDFKISLILTVAQTILTHLAPSSY